MRIEFSVLIFGWRTSPSFGMFRLVVTLGLVLGAIWMFAEGDEFSAAYYELPAWLVDVPPWVVGVVLLLLAGLAAVVPAEVVESAIDLLVPGEDDARPSDIPCAKCGELPPKHEADCDNNPRRYYE